MCKVIDPLLTLAKGDKLHNISLYKDLIMPSHIIIPTSNGIVSFFACYTNKILVEVENTVCICQSITCLNTSNILKKKPFQSKFPESVTNDKHNRFPLFYIVNVREK